MTTNNNVSSSSSSGIGFTGLLTVAFVVLKLTGVINWSWLWVLSPLWIGALVGIAFLIAFFGIAYIVVLVQDRKRRKSRRDIRLK